MKSRILFQFPVQCFMIISAITLCSISVDAQAPEGPVTIDIPNHEPSGEDPELFDLHVIKEGDSYKVAFYPKHKNAIQEHRAYVSVPEVYSHATYEWVSKNRAEITLFNPNTDDAFTFRVWGNGRGTTGMEIRE